MSKGAKHYGKGGAYEGFTGKDASRSFVSGDFTEVMATVPSFGPSNLNLHDIVGRSLFENNADLPNMHLDALSALRVLFIA